MYKVIVFIFLILQIISIKASNYITTLQVLDDDSIISGKLLSNDNNFMVIAPDHKTIKNVSISLTGKTKFNPNGTNYNNVYVNPVNPKEMYASIAGIQGGFYYSINEGMSWSELHVKNQYDYYPSYYIDIDIDPYNFNKIYIKTVNGKIYSSNDGGQNFKNITKSLDGYFFSTKVKNLFVHPKKTNHLTITTDYGLYESNNYGKNWSLVNSRNDFEDIIKDINNDGTFYLTNKNYELEKSTDGAHTFTKINTDVKIFGIFQNNETGEKFASTYVLDKKGYISGMGVIKITESDNSLDIFIPIKEDQYITNISFNKNEPNKVYISDLNGITIFNTISKNIIENIKFDNKSSIKSSNFSKKKIKITDLKSVKNN